jgi:hypothetical protein
VGQHAGRRVPPAHGPVGGTVCSVCWRDCLQSCRFIESPKCPGRDAC